MLERGVLEGVAACLGVETKRPLRNARELCTMLASGRLYGAGLPLASSVRIVNGTRVVLRGLVGAAELNGRRGTVRRFEKERYTILIDRSEEE